MATTVGGRFDEWRPPVRHATRRIAATSMILVLGVVAAGCTYGQHVTGYGTDLKSNFVSACKQEVFAGGANTTTSLKTLTADDGYCECVYKKLHETYNFDFDRLTAYEDEVAKSKPGEVPAPPEEVTKSMAQCPEKAGPSLPKGSTTSVKG